MQPLGDGDASRRAARSHNRDDLTEPEGQGRRASPLNPRSLSSPVLIGRNGELTMLVDELVTRPPSVAVIEGEAGVGKSRLIAELLTRPELAGIQILISGCEPLRDPFPLGPVVHALRGLGTTPNLAALSPVAGVLRALLPELDALLPPAPVPLGDARVERHLLFRAVHEILSSIGQSVWVLEDVHWCDEQTADLLAFLVAQLPATLALVLTYRPEELPVHSPLLGLLSRVPSHVATGRIELRPLNVDEVGKLIGAILGAREISKSFAALVHQRTSGIPFAVEEVVRLAQERRHLVLRRGGWEPAAPDALEVPPGVRDAVLQRVGRLSDRAKRIVEAAAVHGVPATEQELAATAAVDEREAVDALREGLDHAVLFEIEGDRHGFRHPLACHGIYESIPGAQRRRLHLRVAHHLEAGQRAGPAQIAHHYRMAGRSPEWIRYAEEAADRAAEHRDDESAVSYLCELLSSDVVTGASRGRLAVKLGQAAARALRGQAKSIALLRRVLREEELPPTVAGEARALLGHLLRMTGDASSGYREQVRAVDELRDRPKLACRVMTELGNPWVPDVELGEHLRWLDNAAELAARQHDPALTLRVDVARATILAYAGDSRAWDAIANLPDAAPAFEDRQLLLWAVLDFARATFILGHFQRTRHFLADAARRIEELSYPSLVGEMDTDALLLRWATGEWEGLEEKAAVHAEATEDIPRRRIPALLILGLIAIARGDLDPAEALLRAAVDTARGGGLIPGMSRAASGLGRIRLARGDAEGAWREVRVPVATVRAKGIWVWGAEVVPVAVEALIACGRMSEARELALTFRRGLRRRDAPMARASLALALGLVAEAEEEMRGATRAFTAAARGFLQLPRPHDAARAQTRAGACRLAMGDTGGQAHLMDALAIFTQLGATGDVDRLRKLLRQHSVVVPMRPQRRGRRLTDGGLTAREFEIVQLAADGRTNAQIAQQLFISPKTVEWYMTQAMRKLGVTSRTILASRWHREQAPR